MIAQPENICIEIQASLTRSGLFSDGSSNLGNSWRISPEPFFLSSEDAEFFHQLGPHLLKFYTTWNDFYLGSIKGTYPKWFAQYLDAGKPHDLVELGRMKRFRRTLPAIIRPDVIVTEDGFAVTELDSVPGGFGLTAELMSLYKDPSWQIIGDSEGGIPTLFYKMAEAVTRPNSRRFYANVLESLVILDLWMDDHNSIGDIRKLNRRLEQILNGRTRLERENYRFGCVG